MQSRRRDQPLPTLRSRSPCASWAPPRSGLVRAKPLAHPALHLSAREGCPGHCDTLFTGQISSRLVNLLHQVPRRLLELLVQLCVLSPSGSDTSWLRPCASRLCQFQPRPQQKYAGPRAPAQSLTSARAPAPITSVDSRVHFPLAVPAQQREIALSRRQE